MSLDHNQAEQSKLVDELNERLTAELVQRATQGRLVGCQVIVVVLCPYQGVHATLSLLMLLSTD